MLSPADSLQSAEVQEMVFDLPACIVSIVAWPFSGKETNMATYIMFGQYSGEALKGISASRTEKAMGIIKKLGGKLVNAYALLGKIDLVLVVDLPGNKEAVKASLALTKLTGISFTTAPAFPVEEFDKFAK